MSQEHRLCAEIYARLFLFVDQSKRIAISPDGQAHLPDFPDVPVPDLCFTLKGKGELRIEAKVLKDETRRIQVQPNQRAHWFDELCEVAPNYWLIATIDLRQCWLIEHSLVAERMAVKEGLNINLNLWPNALPPQPKTMDEICIDIVNANASPVVEIVGGDTP